MMRRQIRDLASDAKRSAPVWRRSSLGVRPQLTGLLLCLFLATGEDASAADRADAGTIEHADCRVRIAAIDPRGVATVAAECHWPVAPDALVSTLRAPDALREALSSLVECRRLPDGRLIQVHSVGWPLADRQVTLDWSEALLADGGLRIHVQPAARQEPLAEGRVAIAASESRWEIRPDGSGGTRLTYQSRYDAGGSLKPWLVRRFQKHGVASSLAEIRAASASR